MDPHILHAILASHPRVAITGGPKAGKSSLSQRIIDRPVFHTDSYNQIPFDKVGSHIATTLRPTLPPKFVIEGVHALSAIKHGLKVDAIIHLPKEAADTHLKSIGGSPLRPAQASMHKAQATRLNQIKTNFPNIPIY